MPRSKWKGPFVDLSIMKKVMDASPAKGIKIYSRRSVITTDFIGLKFLVHNGKEFLPVRVVPQMVGHKFGEFSKTRKMAIHTTEKDDQSKAGQNERNLLEIAAAQAAAAGVFNEVVKRDDMDAKGLLGRLRLSGLDPAGASLAATAAPAAKPAAKPAKKPQL